MEKRLSYDERIRQHEDAMFKQFYRGHGLNKKSEQNNSKRISVLEILEIAKESNPAQYFAICKNQNIIPEERMIRKFPFIYVGCFQDYIPRDFERENKERIQVKGRSKHANRYSKPEKLTVYLPPLNLLESGVKHSEHNMRSFGKIPSIKKSLENGKVSY